MSREREEWLRDLNDRQRNIVFPDTAANEARFWRNLFNGTRTLSGVQITGVVVLAIAVLALVVGISIEEKGGSLWQTTLIALIRWTLAIAILGGFLIAFRLSREWDRRRALKRKTTLKHGEQGSRPS
jgi:H+/Cl- antiporter ClcA